MDLFLYNSLSKKKEKFEPLNPGKVTLYTCGPTVYSFAHIGNMSAYLMADILIRVLELLGYEVQQVKNITDVGHLVSDGDEGEDKMDREAKRQNKDPYEIAEFYTQAYIRDEQLLGMKEPFARPKATDYVPMMIQMVEKLVKDGFAYETSDGIYMDIQKIPYYGKLSGNIVADLDAGARVQVNEEKKHPADFALWKKADPNHIMQWDSPWGKSFPGWHLECSAMAWEYFHDTYDIKTGGEDNIFPHHECEIAQTFALFKKPLARFFIHKRHIRLNNMKMAKSEGNIINVQDLIQQGYSPEAIRFALISTHYRNRLNFDIPLLEQAEKFIQKINSCIQEIYDINNENQGIEFKKRLYTEPFLQALCDDLNIADAIASIHECVKYFYLNKELLSSNDATEFLEVFKYYNQVLKIFTFEKQEIEIPEYIREYAEKRFLAKQEKRYQDADTLRNEIESDGYQITDTPDGFKLSKNDR